MGTYGTVIVRQLSKESASRKGYYRYLNNERVTETELISAQSHHCMNQVAGKELLIMQDTTEPNYEWNRNRIEPGSGLGVISDDKSLGYFLHPSLVVDAANGGVLGIGDVKQWIREEDRQRIRGSQQDNPIEEKESYRWIECAQNCKDKLSTASRITVVQDREGEQYESFVRLPQGGIDLLVRCRINRRLVGKKKLYEYLAGQERYLSYELEVKDNPKRKSRTALMQLRFAKVQIQRPDRLKQFGYPEQVEMYALLVQEQAQSVPPQEDPIRWVLLTTHVVEDFQTALTIVRWYTERWLIEELFRIWKTQGFDIESSTIENGMALRKLGIMALHESMRVLQLKQARDGISQQGAEVVFDEEQQACLEQVNEQVQGNTEKQQNPHPPHSLAWACWIIARLGGWTNDDKNRPPGVITLKRGLDRFDLIFIGWKIDHIRLN